MKFSPFKVFKPKGEPTRAPRTARAPLSDTLQPTADERTVDAAIQILENGAFDRVMERLRTERLQGFAVSAPGTRGELDREQAHQGLLAIDAIRNGIQAIADQKKLHRRRED